MGYFAFISLCATFATFLIATTAGAGTLNDPHFPISHCYHWLDEASDQYLSYKYSWADNNKNELTFHTTKRTSNGSVAGPGLYCAKSPVGSYGYGDRVIRVDFVDDVVLYDDTANIKYCGTAGETSRNSAKCANKAWDVKFFSGGGVGNKAWYVVRNPMAIQSWSANSDVLVRDLRDNISVSDSNFRVHAQNTIAAVLHERKSLGEQIFYNANARLNLIDIIINEPDKIDTIPPLSVVAGLAVSEDKRLSANEKSEMYKRLLRRALQSDEIEFSEYKELAEKDQEIGDLLLNAAMQKSSELDSHNGWAILQILKRRETLDELNRSSLQLLIRDVMSNPYHMKELAQSESLEHPSIKSHAQEELENIKSQQIEHKFGKSLPALVASMHAGDAGDKERKYWIERLFSGAYGEVGLSFGNESYFLSESDFKEQCDGLLALDGTFAQKKANFVYRGRVIPLADVDRKFCDKAGTLLQKFIALGGAGAVDYVVLGSMEKESFAFVGNTIEEFTTQCQEFFPTLSNKNVDEISYAVNGERMPELVYTNSYWSASDGCQELAKGLSSKVPTKLMQEWKAAAKQSKPAFVVEGDFSGQRYFFYGENLEEIQQQCMTYHSHLYDSRMINALSWKVNGAEQGRDKVFNGAWTRDYTLCSRLSYLIGNEVPNESTLTRIAEAAAASPDYILEGFFEKQPFYFYGENLDTIITQCETFENSLFDHRKLDEIQWRVNGAQARSFYGDGEYWHNSYACELLQEHVGDQIPSELDIKARAFAAQKRQEAEDVPAAYQIAGNFAEQDFFFYGETQEHVYQQCVEFYSFVDDRNRFKQMTYKINNGQETTEAYDGNVFYASSVCDKLNQLIAETVPTEAQVKAARALEELKREAETSKPKYSIAGKFDEQEFFFYGNNLDEIGEQCSYYDQHILDRHISKIVYSVNNGEAAEATGYFRSFFCRGLIEQLNGQVPTLAMINAQEALQELKTLGAKSSADYIVEGAFDGQDFYFFGDNVDEIYGQCSDYDEHVLDRHITQISYSVNQAAPQVHTGSFRSYFCSYLKRFLEKEVPSRLYLERVALEKKWEIEAKKKEWAFAIQATVEGRRIHLSGDNLSQVQGKCDAFYEKLLNKAGNSQIRLSFNGRAQVKGTANAANSNDFCGTFNGLLNQENFLVLKAKRETAVKELYFDLYPEQSDSEAFEEIIVSENANTLYFKARDFRQAKERCLNILPRIEAQASLIGAKEVKVQVGSKPSHTEYLSDDADSEEFCSRLSRSLYLRLPSQELLEHKQAFQQGDFKYKVSAKLNGNQFFLYGQSAQDLENQCLEIYADNLDEDVKRASMNITWTVNDDSKVEEFQSADLTMGEFCPIFSQEALKGGLGRFFRGVF